MALPVGRGLHEPTVSFCGLTMIVSCLGQELLGETHVRLARDMEADGDLGGAEKHFVEAGHWQEAADMYARSAAWEDALRVAKAHGGSAAHTQVIHQMVTTLEVSWEKFCKSPL